MRKSILILLIAFVASVRANVAMTSFYDNRDVAICWTSDDMASIDSRRWEPFVAWAELCASNHIVPSPGVMVGRMTEDGWTTMQAMMDAGTIAPTIHSWDHPVHIEDYELQYLTSRTTLLAELDFGATRRYKGAEYHPYFIQWGGCTNIDYDISLAMMSSNNYLAVRLWEGGALTWPEWNTNGMFGVDQWTRQSCYSSAILDGSYSNRLMNAIADNGIFHIYNHTWQSAFSVIGTNAVAMTNFVEYVGNRKNAWYASPCDVYTYHYLQAIASPAITWTNHPEYIHFEVSGDPVERAKYGLSYPLTFEVDKPDDWAHDDGYSVYVKSADMSGWQEMAEKTTNDYFTGINCYRDASNLVYVSCALPEWSDSFEIEIRRASVGAEDYWLDISINGSGTINLADGWYPSGTNLTISAVPDHGWLFMNWCGDLTGGYTTATTNFIMNDPKRITATFSDDADGDGLSNTEESSLGTNPRKADTDGDLILDKDEVDYGLNPMVSNTGADSDLDGLSDVDEVNAHGTDPLEKDSDGDDFDDGWEVAFGWDATSNNAEVVSYILDNQSSFELYTPEQLGALAVGGLMIRTSNNAIQVDLQLMKSDDLTTWTNGGDAVEWSIPAGNKKFFKVRASP